MTSVYDFQGETKKIRLFKKKKHLCFLKGIFGDECPVELSQKTSRACQERRYRQLLANKNIYQLVPISFLPNEPIRWLNMTSDKMVSCSTDSHSAHRRSGD